ncbi:MAG: hypothetical protein M3395_07025 [Chloroflexota bacterium]|nr:hypothetical protein [Chloroflexota bacterium]
MRRKRLAALLAATFVVTATIGVAAHDGENHPRLTDDGVADTGVEIDLLRDEQHGGSDGHLPASSENVELVGKLQLTGLEGGISDVSAFGDYAYLAAFRPHCGNAGVHVVDISDPASPSKVAFIPADPNVFVGEGVHVIHVDNEHFTGEILIHNNEACNTPATVGGVSLWDVTDPTDPQPLALGVGDTVLPNGNPRGRASTSHSAQGFTVGEKAYVVLVDNEELLDVDILDISDPTAPVQIAEVGLPQWPDAQSPLARGNTTFHHDMQVKQIDGHWYLLLSYWDAGYILLDIDDPADPVFLKDYDFPDPDPLTGFSPPEGNGHQAYWSTDNKYILATDEDFSPYRLIAKITSGSFANEEFTAVPARGIPQVTPDDPLIGPSYFLGQACSTTGLSPAPSPDAVAVVERGVCSFQAKATTVNALGYAGGIVFNSASSGNGCETLINMLITSSNVPMMFVARSSGFEILNISGYGPANCPTGSNPALPALNTQGANVDIQSVFDGWGYVHLIDAKTLTELDQYAVPESLDEAFATGFGNLTVHEVKTDPRRVNLAYISYYDAGLRVVKFGRQGIKEVGHYIAQGGNDFWGTFPHQLPANPKANGGAPYLLMSDRDSGLWIFRYTGD